VEIIPVVIIIIIIIDGRQVPSAIAVRHTSKWYHCRKKKRQKKVEQARISEET
jgi:hypothetical protein